MADLAPYLAALGVSDTYLSPCFKCGPGSTHGYDVTDHDAFNPEVGSEATFDRMAAALAAHGLGLILDVVPNHMGIAGDSNPWWIDVLENGPSSPRADSSTSTGIRSSPTWKTRCCSPSSTTSTAARWRGEAPLRALRGGAFFVTTPRRAFR